MEPRIAAATAAVAAAAHAPLYTERAGGVLLLLFVCWGQWLVGVWCGVVWVWGGVWKEEEVDGAHTPSRGGKGRRKLAQDLIWEVLASGDRRRCPRAA